MTDRDRSLARAVLAAALGLAVLSGAGATQARWSEERSVSLGTIRAGGVDIAVSSRTVLLHSQQPAGARTYASGTTCPPDAGYVQCRVITATVAQEAVIPGDRIVYTEVVRLTAGGTNLRGTLTLDVTSLTAAVSPVSTTTVTAPDGTARTGSVVTVPVRGQSANGSYTVRTVVSTPATNGAAAWGTELWDHGTYAGSSTYTFTQG